MMEETGDREVLLLYSLGIIGVPGLGYGEMDGVRNKFIRDNDDLRARLTELQSLVLLLYTQLVQVSKKA